MLGNAGGIYRIGPSCKVSAGTGLCIAGLETRFRFNIKMILHKQRWRSSAVYSKRNRRDGRPFSYANSILWPARFRPHATVLLFLLRSVISSCGRRISVMELHAANYLAPHSDRTYYLYFKFICLGQRPRRGAKWLVCLFSELLFGFSSIQLCGNNLAESCTKGQRGRRRQL